MPLRTWTRRSANAEEFVHQRALRTKAVADAETAEQVGIYYKSAANLERGERGQITLYDDA